VRALVTGASGFVGQYLCRELLEAGWSICGTTFGDVVPTTTLTLDERRQIRWVSCDLRRSEGVRAALDEATPDAVFHLAGVSYLPDAQVDPGEALEANVVAASRLIGDIRRRRRTGVLDPVVLVVGSGEQYGRHEPDEMPLAETAAQLPVSVYAASKVAQEAVALEAFRSEGVRVIGTRSFNHSGAGQGGRFLLPSLVRRALTARNSWQRQVPIGNVHVTRDLLHVGDVVHAYVMLANRGMPGEVYNVSSGIGRDVQQIAERVLALAGVDAKLQVDPALVRPVDVPALVGDPAKLRAATGWAPARPFDTIITDLLRATAH
jgi:GDP-4-dehydro-6-deoxy-D-mannose reductase